MSGAGASCDVVAASCAMSSAQETRKLIGSMAVSSAGVGGLRFAPKGLKGYFEALRIVTYAWNLSSSSFVHDMAKFTMPFPCKARGDRIWVGL